MPIVLDATVTSGFGAAAANLAKQLPHFLAEPGLTARLPILAQCHAGTINVYLEQPLLLPVERSDFITSQIAWDPLPQPPEQFAFLAIEFECPTGAHLQPALFYIAFNSPYFHDPFRCEIIAPKIIAAATGTRCRIHIARHQEPFIVVGSA